MENPNKSNQNSPESEGADTSFWERLRYDGTKYKAIFYLDKKEQKKQALIGGIGSALLGGTIALGIAVAIIGFAWPVAVIAGVAALAFGLVGAKVGFDKVEKERKAKETDWQDIPPEGDYVCKRTVTFRNVPSQQAPVTGHSNTTTNAVEESREAPAQNSSGEEPRTRRHTT